MFFVYYSSNGGDALDKLSMGLFFMIAGILSLSKIITLDSVYVFCFSLSALLMSISSFIDNPLEDTEKIISISKIIKFISYFVSIGALILLPHLNKTQVFIQLREKITDDAILLFSIGITLLSMCFGEWQTKLLKQKHKIEQRQAIEDVKQDILNKLKRKN